VAGTNEIGDPVVLLMFNCTYSFQMPASLMGDEISVQAFLDNWRVSSGDEWLESLGPVMKLRELKNMEKGSKNSKTTFEN
jgi:hypothetical protein